MSARITDVTFNRLVELIYEAACDLARWPEFLMSFARAVEGRGTLFFNQNLDSMEASTACGIAPLNAAVNFDPEYLTSYVEYYSRLNVWVMNERELPAGQAVTGPMLFPERELLKTEYYNDFLRPQDSFHVIGGIVVRDGAWVTKFSSLRSRRTGDFNIEEINLYQALLPHLARAVQIQGRFAYLQNLSSASLAVIDTAPAAVMLLDRSARVLHSNATAELELRRADPLRFLASGELQIRGCARAQAALRTAIAAALDPVRAIRGRSRTFLQVSRSNGELLSVQAVPLPWKSGGNAGATINQGAAACALIIHASSCPPTAEKLLREIYGLTPAEVQIAMAIVAGESVKQYAERRRISRNTAVSQLKRAFEKTGFRRQSELVRWLLQCGATLRPGSVT